MAAINDLSDLVNRATGGNSGTPDNAWFHKLARIAGAAATAPVLGRFASLWLYDGLPGPGAAPGAAAIPTRATAGALAQVNPGGGRQKWLYSLSASSTSVGVLTLYDRLFHISGLSGTVTTAQNVQTTTPTPALTRYTDGIGNQAWIEIYTAIGASTSAVTMNYRNQANASVTSPSVVIGNTGFNAATRSILLPLAAGDTGLQAVESVDLTVTTGTAGNFGVTIAHPLAYLPFTAAGFGAWRDFATGLPGIPEILTDACLAWAWMPASTAAPELFGTLSMIEA